VARQWQPGDVLVLDLDVTPRLTYPSRHIDALRGTVAIERGPLVYCFEQADQGDVDVEDLGLGAAGRAGLGEQAAPAELGQAVAVTVAAVQLPPAAGVAYAGEAADSGGQPVTAVAIPYFQWDNRDGAPMRVWLPVYRAEATASAASSEPDRVPRPRRIP
jgi:uncharacterized protein